jgi:hypothetical protein
MSPPKRILYRGIPKIEGWPDKIEAAQRVPFYTLTGQVFCRIRYGDEQGDWDADKRACHDYRVLKGELHVPGCDGEECPAYGGQLHSCDCPFDNLADNI